MKKRNIVIALIIALSVIVISGCGAHQKPEGSEPSNNDESISQEEKIGFTTTDLQGNEVTQTVFGESRLTILNVWATYCSPCIAEMPYLGELSKEYDSADVQIIGIPMDVYNEEYLAYAEQLIAETGADYTHLLLSQELYDWGLTDVQYVPTTFFVNSEGEVINTMVGSFSKEDWKKIIDEQLASM